MHIHHYTLEKIAEKIWETVPKGMLAEAFSQERDQLVLGLATPDDELYLRIACAAPLPFIWPVKQFHKAKRNVKNLFETLYGLHMTRISVVPHERVLVLHFEDDYDLVLKMHGLLSNVLLLKNGELVERFRHNQENDLSFQDWANITIPMYISHEPNVTNINEIRARLSEEVPPPRIKRSILSD
ncbi:MAG: hypothetical protein AAF570_21865, partial [Bacteroidota bacterium]